MPKRTKKTRNGARTAKKTQRTRRDTEPAPASPPFRTVTPYLAVNNANEAIEWYKRALGAKEISRMPVPGGLLMHAELEIGDSRVLLSDIFPGSDLKDPKVVGPSTTLHVFHKNIDKIWKQAIDAGATVTMPLENQFWGDRYGKLIDPFGHSWSLAYPAKMTESEKKQKEAEAMKQFAAGIPSQ